MLLILFESEIVLTFSENGWTGNESELVELLAQRRNRNHCGEIDYTYVNWGVCIKPSEGKQFQRESNSVRIVARSKKKMLFVRTKQVK